MIRRTLFFLLVLISSSVTAGSISGVVYDENKEPLPGATIYVVELQAGTASNSEGYYQLNLDPGRYTIIFRFIGYKPFTQRVVIQGETATLDVNLEPQSMVLKSVVIDGSKEDPAYTIMRKAIAKAGYYRNIVDSYTSVVYMKGNGNMNKIPLFLKKKLKEEGIDTERYFVSESVSEIKFTRPGNYDEKVLSVRSTGDDGNSSPNQYISDSFYEPEIAEIISPLHPRAFAYYKFEYLGSFFEGGHEINRIKVISKSTGDHLVNGEIGIVESDWGIHSLQLDGSKLGIGVHLEQLYQEFKGLAWLPVTHKFQVEAKIVGVGFTYDYLVSANYKEVQINQELLPKMAVVDTKIEKEKAEELASTEQAEITEKPANENSNTAEITNKELRKQLKEYEKSSQKKSKEPDVLISKTYSYDSMAYKRDKDYWNQIRPVPLTEKDKLGYHQTDSIAGNLEKDTTETGKKKRRFSPLDLVKGRYYRLNRYNAIFIDEPIENIGYNTVEGLNIDYSFGYRYRRVKNASDPTIPNITQHAYFTSHLRYSFARNKLLPYFTMDIGSRLRPKWIRMKIEGGSKVYQLNDTEPINPFLNTIYTLFFEENYMKLYQSDELKLWFSRTFSGRLTADLTLGYQYRRELFNNSSVRFIDWEDKEFTDNAPINDLVQDTSFPGHSHTFAELKLVTRPFLKYRIRNGNKIPMRDTSPTVTFTLRKAFPDIFDGATDYLYQEILFNHDLNLEPFATLNLEAGFSSFLGKENMYFMDYNHFRGNQTLISPGNELRLLNYYRFSNDNYAFSVATNLKFKNNFFLTRLPFLAREGVKDFAIFNYLNVEGINGYFEVGYGLDYLFKFLRIEAVTSFIDGRYDGFGIRIGLPPEINID